MAPQLEGALDTGNIAECPSQAKGVKHGRVIIIMTYACDRDDDGSNGEERNEDTALAIIQSVCAQDEEGWRRG